VLFESIRISDTLEFGRLHGLCSFHCICDLEAFESIRISDTFGSYGLCSFKCICDLEAYESIRISSSSIGMRGSGAGGAGGARSTAHDVIDSQIF
jgi:hypothetical protein